MDKKRLVILVFVVILISNLNIVFAYASVNIQYINPSKGQFLITINTPSFQGEKVLIVQIFVNRTLYQTYYYNGNESYPITILITLGQINGDTYLGVRVYTNISGWGNLYEILVNNKGIIIPSVDYTRDTLLVIGIILLLGAVYYLVRKI